MQVKLEERDIASAQEIYLFSNTPSMLLKELRQERFVAALSERYPSRVLEEFLAKLVSEYENNPETNERLLKIYIILASMSLKPWGEVQSLFKSAKGDDIYWVPQIKTLSEEAHVKTNLLVIDNLGSDLSGTVYSS